MLKWISRVKENIASVYDGVLLLEKFVLKFTLSMVSEDEFN